VLSDFLKHDVVEVEIFLWNSYGLGKIRLSLFSGDGEHISISFWLVINDFNVESIVVQSNSSGQSDRSLNFDHVPIEVELSRFSQSNSENFIVLKHEVNLHNWIVVDLSLDYFPALVELVSAFFKVHFEFVEVELVVEGFEYYIGVYLFRFFIVLAEEDSLDFNVKLDDFDLLILHSDGVGFLEVILW